MQTYKSYLYFIWLDIIFSIVSLATFVFNKLSRSLLNSFASAIFKEGKEACGVDAKSWLLPFKTKTPSPRVDDLKVFVGSKEESTVFTENFVDSDTVNCPKTRLGKKQKARQKPLQALDKFEELEIISIRVNCKVVPLKRYLICNASKKLKIKNIC